MLTIIKSVLRFFKNSKSSIIGLFLLIFFSSSIFTLLNHMKQNLQNSYTNISAKGNLHDFVINEHYALGFADYEWTYKQPNPNKKVKYVIKATSNWTNGYKKVFDKYKDNPEYQDLFLFEFTAEPPTTDSSGQLQYPESLINFVNEQKNKLTQFTKREISNIFKENLEDNFKKYDLNIRDFSAIDINNNKQNMFFKVVETDPDYTVDKLVTFSGKNVSKPKNIYDDITSELKEIIQSKQNNFTPEEKKIINQKSRKLVNVLSLSNWTDGNNKFIKLNDYLNITHNFNPYIDSYTGSDNIIKTALEQLKKFIDSLKETNRNGYFIYNRGFQIRFEFKNLGIIPVTGIYEDFSSHEAVISDDYAKLNHKKPIDNNLWNSHLNDHQKDFLNFLKTIPTENKIFIDNNEFVIVGTGVSPDFMYPIVSFESVVPNKEKEQIIYVNKNGYQKVEDSFKGNNTEKFIVGKFSNKLEDKQIKDILKDINNFSKEYMLWPENIDSAYAYNDLNNTLTPSALRVQFIPQTVAVTNIVSLFMTSFILFLSIFISLVIVKKFIDTNRNSLGIMQANGYKKIEIIFAIDIFIAIPIIIATICGYILGFFLQQPSINLLGNFWTIPTTFANFSLTYLLIICIGILILFLLITTIFSWFSLSAQTSEFMKDEARYKMSKISRIMKSPFSKFGIITRFRATIAFSSLTRLILLSIMSSSLMISLTFSFAILNKYDEALNLSFSPRNYEYSIKMFTPTTQGGQYYAVPFSHQGMAIKKNHFFNKNQFLANEIMNNQNQFIVTSATQGPYDKITEVNLKNTLFENANFQLVSQEENSRMNSKIDYLKNQSTNKAFLAHNIGLGSLSANPWEIASSMMPPNNVNYLNETYNNLFGKAINDIESVIELTLNNKKDFYSYSEIMNYFTVNDPNNNPSPSSNSFIYGFNDKNEPLYKKFDNKKVINGTKISDAFLTFLFDLYNNSSYSQFLYSINYNKVIINSMFKTDESLEKSDEPFSYLDFKIKKINDKDVNIVDSLFATGIYDSRSFDLSNLNGKKINEKLNVEDFIPIIPNAFAKKKYNLKVGDTIEVDVLNSVDRFSRKIFQENNNNITPVKAILKIIDFTSTYQNNEFFMHQFDVNKILGLNINGKNVDNLKEDQISDTVNWENKLDGITKKDFKPYESGFNGLHTYDLKNVVQITNGVSLYSPSGLYPAIDKFEVTPFLLSLFNNNDNINKILDIIGAWKSSNNKISASELIEKLKNIFGDSIQYSIISNVEQRNMMVNVFSSVTHTATNIQNVVLSIIILISLIIVIIISSLIITDSMKLAAILKCLGYSDTKNALSFLSIYTPVLILGLIIAIPISYWINLIYVNVVFGFAGILLTINMVWWHYLLSFGIIMFIFFISYAIAWYKIHGMNLRQAIK